MSLPSPNLDVRSFQSLVDDIKRQIGLRCPEWTDHNVSDPGITLLELFAYLTELTLFRLNQVPEKNYVKFLEMLGISLEMPEAARGELRFRLSRWIEDVEAAAEHEVTLRGGHTIAATVRTETEEAIEFITDADLKMVRPKLAHVLAVPRQDAPDGDREPRGVRQLAKSEEPLEDRAAFAIFSPVPAQDDSLYLGFEADVSQNLIEIQVQCLNAAATGLNESYPAQVWEFWNGAANEWARLNVVSDTTFGFNRPGSIEIEMAGGLQERAVGNRRAYWVRCRYTVDPADVPPKGVDQRAPDPYQKPPEITFVKARTIGGTTPASQCAVVRNEVLGVSDGTPGQVFRLLRTPALRLGAEETVLVGAVGSSPQDMEGWTTWTRVPDFSESQADDRHFTCDELTGEIAFGPVIGQPDGSARQYGAIPEKGLTVGVSAYRVGGGTLGNVRENAVRVLKGAYPYISSVTNPNKATGGRDLETLERAKMRTLEVLKVRNRAVTAEDFEFLAAKASPGVGRARCLQPLTLAGSDDGRQIPPGVVKVFVVPALSRETLIPRPVDLKVPQRTIAEVSAYLDERRLLTAVLEVGEPEYVYVSIDIKLVADPRANAEAVARRVQEQLYRYLHPLFGGPLGTGWPFRRTLTLADVYAQVGAVRGVAFLLDARMFVSQLANYDEGLLGPESPVAIEEGVRLAENQLLCSRQHNIRVVPMSAVGQDEGTVTV